MAVPLWLTLGGNEALSLGLGAQALLPCPLHPAPCPLAGPGHWPPVLLKTQPQGGSALGSRSLRLYYCPTGWSAGHPGDVPGSEWSDVRVKGVLAAKH